MTRWRRAVRLLVTVASAALAAVGHAATPERPLALQMPTGKLPIHVEAMQPLPLSADDDVEIEGVVGGDAPAALALRIDDRHSTSYATRYNDERMIPPGPFRLTLPLGGLRAADGHALDATQLTRIIVFAWQGAPDVSIARFEARRRSTMPAGAHGYAFGDASAALPAGFERVSPNDPRITGRGAIRAIRRPAPDPLVANGLTGVRRVVLPAPAARVHVSIWSEDPGEWELLPHPLQRRITVNGSVLVDDHLTYGQWLAGRYLRNGMSEHDASDDAWSAYGRRRGNLRSLDVAASAEGIVIELEGATPDAYFLNAVVVEPALADGATQTPPGESFAMAERARWYREHFPVLAGAPRDDKAATTLSLDGASGTVASALALTIAADTGARARVSVSAQTTIAHPRVIVTPPSNGAVVLSTRVWAAQVRLERDGSVLRLAADRLLADTHALPVNAGVSRNYELWIDVPRGAPAGRYRGALTIAGADGAPHRLPIDVTVPPIHLPDAPKPAGFYLASAPQYATFGGLAPERAAQARCDLDLFAGLGLHNTAPPIDGLDKPSLAGFAEDMHRAAMAGVTPGWLVYNPLDRLVRADGVERAAAAVGRIEAFIRATHLPEPLWSAADEPSNPDQPGGDLAGWISRLRAASPGIRLAGHLNAPADWRYVPLFDTVLLNAGFGIDADRLEAIAGSGKAIWLYNTGAPRQTAGLWLWRTRAERYLQWHARMPTADPFDPLDGREADFQVIYPSAGVCPAQPDIDRALLMMAEGVVDQRWLAWLDAQTTPAARALAAELRAKLPDRFADVRRLSDADLELIRNRIVVLAAAPH